MSVATTYRQGRTEFNARAFLDYATRHVIAYDDLTSGVYRLPIDTGRHILGIRMRVSEAFTGATSIKVGDGANDSGYLPTGVFDPTSLNAVLDTRHNIALASGAAYCDGGRYYAAPGFLVVTIAGSLSAGELILEPIFDGFAEAQNDELVNQ